MDKKKTTILIIGYEGETVRSFNISTKLIENYKKYLFSAGALVSVFILLLAGISYYIHHIRSENGTLSEKLTNLTSSLHLADSLKINEKLNNIDYNLSMINNYLITRGIIPSNSEGGEISLNQHDGFSKVNYLEDESEVFLKTLQNIPIGLPYGGTMSSPYGHRSNPFGGFSGEFHPGIDLKGPYGDAVYATADGIVERSDWNGGYGNAVVIYHALGYTTLYGHLSRVNVTAGERIKAGDLVGFIGSTGRSTGPHLHYEIRKNGEDIDPLPFLKLN